MPKYDTVVDLSDTNDSHSQTVLLVGGAKRVLDVGCATGYTARELAEHGCSVSGVDLDAEAAEAARPYLNRLVIGDLETLDLVQEFGEASFDAVVLGDVLEHLRNPAEVLRRMRPILAPDGFIVASIPNVAHGDLRLALLQGRWEYRELGLLDDTHVRFFTRDSIENLLWDSGFSSVETRRIFLDLFNSEIGVRPEDFAPDLIEYVRNSPESTTYQFVVKALPDDGSSGIRQLRAREEDQRLRLIELEKRADAIARRVEELELEVEDAGRDLRQAEDELQAVYSTRTMRLVRVPRRAYGMLRRGLFGASGKSR